MTILKTPEEIEIMREGGHRLKVVMDGVLAKVKPGISTAELDQIAEKLVESQDGFPSFKKVKGYKWTSCINLNEGVVHGIPGKEIVKTGDLVSVDLGILYKGFNTDMARTVIAGDFFDTEKERFLAAGRKALKRAIKKARPGKRIGDLSETIETVLGEEGFKPVRELTGHGIGKKLHEDPQIPGIARGRLEKTEVLCPGMVLAIEVIYAQGSPSLVMKADGWTIETRDRKLAGLFEDTVAITHEGPVILTA